MVHPANMSDEPFTYNYAMTSLAGLPIEIGRYIFSLVDIPSVCMLYIALESSSYANEIAEYLDEHKVEVTANYVTMGDPNKIHFDTLARLPPCHIRVTCTLANVELMLWYLEQVTVKSVELEIIDQGGRYSHLSHPDLKFLGTTLTKLCLERIVVAFHRIPITVTHLQFKDCMWEQSWFSDFTNLTRFEADCLLEDEVVSLPQSVISIKINSGIIDASTLPNLKHISGYAISNLPWSQLESASNVAIPSGQRMEQLQELTVDDYQLGENVEFSKLERLEILPEWDFCNFDTYDIPFTQLAQVQVLKISTIIVDNVDQFRNLTTLSCGIDEVLTEDYPLPPNLVDLTITSYKGVKGVPSQLKLFTYIGETKRESDPDTRSVFVKSDRLIKSDISGATSVTIDCPNLTRLDLWQTFDLSVHLPRLVSLTYAASEEYPIPFPFEQGFPNLQEVTLYGSPQDVVFQQPMKLVSLSDMDPNRLKFTADTVHLRDCRIPFATDITARVFSSMLPSISIPGVVCKELTCFEIDRVPSMVEKLSLVLAEPSDKYSSVVPELLECGRLRALEIRGGLDHYQHGISIPPTVKQLTIKDGLSRSERMPSWGKLKFKTPTRLEHFELIGDVTGVEFTSMPASGFLGHHPLDLDPELL